MMLDHETKADYLRRLGLKSESTICPIYDSEGEIIARVKVNYDYVVENCQYKVVWVECGVYSTSNTFIFQLSPEDEDVRNVIQDHLGLNNRIVEWPEFEINVEL